MLNFLIDTSKGETPASVARKRALVAQLMGQSSAPKNVGEGLNALGDGIVAAVMNRRADKAEAAGRGEGSNAFASLFSGLGGVDTQAPEMAGNTAVSPGALPTQDYPSQRVSQAFGDSDIKSGIMQTAQSVGIDPLDLATAISYETAGTFDPRKKGPKTKWGQHEGLIQFGEPQAKQYGVDWNNPIGSQLGSDGAVAKYLKDTGVQPGMGLLDIYSAINAGGVGRYGASDANNGGAPGTVADKVNNQMAGHRQKAIALLGQNATQPDPQMTPEQIVQSFAQSRPQMSQPVNPAMNGMAPPNPSRFAPDAQPVVPGIPGQQTMPLGPQAQQPTGLAAAQPPQPAQMPPMPSPGINPLNNRPILDNGDGSYSTEESITVTDPRLNGGRPTNIPSIWGGRRTASEDQAVTEAIRSGQMFPSFGSIDEAVSAAKARSNGLGAGVPGGAQFAQAGQGQFPPAPPPPQNNRVQQLMQVMTNPWLSDQERQVAGMMLQQEMQKNDPMRALEMEKTRLEMDALRNPKPKYDFLTGRDGSIFRTDNSGKMEQVYGGKPEQPTDVREYEYARQQGYKGNFTDWQIEQKRAGASQVNIDQKAEGAFDKKLAEKQAETFDAMATEGMAANADIAVIGELETLLQGQGGTLSGIAGIAAKYGLGGEGMSDLQAAQALLNKLVPTQRQPGSGTMSDRDVELFTRSLPNLWNTPGGNQKILSVMRGLAQYKQQQGQIAQAVMAGEMTRQEATAALRRLTNPLADFGKAQPKQGKAVIDGYTIEQVD